VNDIKDLKEAFGKKGKKEKIHFTSLHIKNDSFIAEQVYDKENGARFCCYSPSTGKIEYYNSIAEHGVQIRPWFGEEVEKNAIYLPTHAEEYGSDEELDTKLADFITTWLDIPENVLRFGIWNIKRSWVYERFHTLNYLRALGDSGQGKSRFLDTLGYLHYKPIATSGASTAAPIFRIIDKWRGTLIMDEADFQKSDEAQDIIKIINQGYERGRYIMRCDKENKNRVNFFDPFCPKILATRNTFQDKAVESRCITQVMTGTLRKDIKWNLNPDFFEKAMELRNMLLMWRFRHYFTINPNYSGELGVKGLEPRVMQLVNSFVSLFGHNESQLAKFRDFIKSYQDDLVDERRNSFAGTIVEGIYRLKEEDGMEDISAKDIIIQQDMRNKKGELISPRSLSSTLRALGFQKTEIKRIGTETKRCIPLETEHLNSLFRRYGVTVVTIDRDTGDTENKAKYASFGGIHIARNNRNSVTPDNDQPTKNCQSKLQTIKSQDLKNILEIIKHKAQKSEKGLVDIGDISRTALNLDEKDIEHILSLLARDGDIYEPVSGFVGVLE